MAIVELSAPKTIRSLWLILFYLFFMLQISLPADGLSRRGYACDRTFGNNTASAVYGLNRGRLFTQKLYADGAKSIYSNTSDGEDPDKVYGLYLCRRDVTKPTCQSCINEAIGYAISEQACENTKSAITWYDECMVRYADKPFSLTFESEPALTMSNDHNFTALDPVEFRKTLNQSFSQLITDAISSELKYATEIVNISSSVTLYTMGQCIPYLSKEDCSDCLNSAAQLVEYKRNGSRYLYPCCSARFELYQFWNSPVAAQEPVSPVEAPPPPISKKKIWIPITISLVAVVLVVLLGSLIWQIRRRNKRHKEEESNSQEVQLLRLREGRIGNDYSYDTLQGEKQMESQEFPLFPLDLTLEATQHFSDENKLGEGGFGPVYKGILADGKEIAVKRLSKTSGQGLQEFKNEVTLIAKLQHKNLVRLLGCCLEGNEMLLIYEFMPNKSLDFLLFDSSRSIQLDWKTRLGIINGIARGLLYLHEDSRLKIIHRDLKASNVLLDHELNPKISDFGMARIFGEKQSEANTIKVVGTYGYMAPEYAMEGLYSVKSDVFSFGVLLLEIISGRKNSGFYLSEHGLSLLNYTWKLWCEKQVAELMDPVLVQSCIQVELLKYIHIGLLCVQEDQTDRPSMSSVVAMLVTDNIRLPQPTQPAFSVGRAARQGQSLSDVNFFSNEATRSQGQSSSDASDFSNEAARRVRFSSDVV